MSMSILTTPKKSNNHPPSQPPTNPIKRELRQPKSRPHQPPLPILLIRPRIPSRIQRPKHNPRGTEYTRRNGILQPSDKEGREESNVVFEEIVVGALGAVEEVHVLF